MRGRDIAMVAVAVVAAGCGNADRTGDVSPGATDLLSDVGPEGRVPDGVVFPDVPSSEFPDLVSPDGAFDGAREVMGPICKPGDGCFLDKCSQNSQCESGWCVQHLGEGVCSQGCQDECPPGWTCRQVAMTDPDVVFICVSDHANLCRPCAANADCAGTGGTLGACIDYGSDGSFCGSPCGDEQECPWGFSCESTMTVEGSQVTQCTNDAGECPCTDSSVDLGLTTPCSLTNALGTCHGKRTCTEDGLGPCDAATPGEETCNGLDDDCDGESDEPSLAEGKYLELCDDGNGCTQDQCAGDAGCVNTVLPSGECSDGNPCTLVDHCVDGTCVGDPVECDDGNPCTGDVCTAEGGCEYPSNSDPCDDGNPCTVGDLCTEGQCAGTEISCACLEDVDCSAFEDGDLCNGTLVCDTSTLPYLCVVALETVVVCPAPDGPDAFCLEPACDPATGECSFQPDHEGFLCDSADQCAVAAKCSQGQCAGGSAVNCNDGNPCTLDTCEPSAGCVHDPAELPCQDGSVCTLGDQCSAGACVPGGGSLNCDDGKPCTADVCDPDLGCLHSDWVGECDDGNPCTEGDHCQGGLCVGSGADDCEDSNDCTTDYCDPGVGCVHVLNQAPCNDGDPCTIVDVCQKGDCAGLGAADCDDHDPCTVDGCEENEGCFHDVAPDGIPCLAGGLCAGLCQSGVCVGTAEELCDGEDNDCDGHADGMIADCSNGCNDGKMTCTGGQWGPCNAAPPVCTQGDCCDGCNLRPASFQCGEIPLDAEQQCTAANHCGGEVRQRELHAFCSGASPECDSSNPMWTGWKTVQICGEGIPCTQNGKLAACGVPCGEGNACADGQCKPVCGDGMCVAGETPATCPLDCKSPPLVNGFHTIDDCVAAGGAVVANMCRFDAPACPPGWTKYQNWTTTTPAVPCSCNCNGNGCCGGAYVATHLYGCGNTVVTCTGHAWSNTPVESIWAGAKGGGCACYDCCTCYVVAQVTQIGCY